MATRGAFSILRKAPLAHFRSINRFATPLRRPVGMMDAHVINISPINIADGIFIVFIAICIYLAWKSK
jgi:hypothetical protein